MKKSYHARRPLVSAVVATCMGVFCSSVCSQTQDSTAATRSASTIPETPPSKNHKQGQLKLGKPIKHELKGGETDVYAVKLKKGQFFRVVADQQGIDVVVEVVDPGGKSLVAADSSNAQWGPEPASVITEKSGTFEIHIESQDQNAPAGKYEVRITDLRKPTAADKTRITAERTAFEAAKFGAQASREAQQKTVELNEKALPLWREVGDQYEEALTLYNIGVSTAGLGEKKKGLEYLQQSLNVTRAVGDTHLEYFTLQMMSGIDIDLGQLREAKESASQQLAAARATNERSFGAAALGTLGFVEMRLGEKQQATDHLNASLEIDRQLGNRLEECKLLDVLGQLYDDLGDRKKALEYLDQTLSLARNLGAKEEEAGALNNLGLVSNHIGDKKKALDYYTQALAIHRATGNRHEEATTLGNIGMVYDDLGQKEKALEYYTQSLAIERAVANRWGEAVNLNNIGGAYEDLGEKEKALDFYNQALTLDRAIGNKRGEGFALSNMGNVYAALGNLEKARESYEQSLAARREIGDRNGEATSLDQLGTISWRLRKSQDALGYYGQAVALKRETGDRLGESRVLNNIASVYIRLGDLEKGLDYCNQALVLQRAVGDRGGEVSTHANLGTIYEKQGKKEKAIQEYYQSLVLSREVKDVLAEGNTLSFIMQHWEHVPEPALAILFGKEAINAYQQIRANIRGLEKGLQQGFVESKAGTYRELADLLIFEGRLAEAEQVLDLLKEEEYFEFIRRDGRGAESLTKPLKLTPAEQKTYDEYQKIADQVTSIETEWSELRAKPSLSAEEDARVNDLSEKLKLANERMEQYFRELFAEFAANSEGQKKDVSKVREEATSLQALVSELGPGTVALYTLVTEKQYRVIVITPNTMQPRGYEISRVELRHRVAALATALEDPNSDPRLASQELYKIVIGPIEKDLRGAQAKSLMWSMDDVLRYVPVAALYDGKHYMVENYRNTVFTTASLGGLKDQPDVKSWRGLGMGVSKDYDGLGPLPQVPEELKGVIHDETVTGASGVIPGTMMLDDSFTEKNMENALQRQHPLVHIASHFMLQPGSDTDSFLLLGGKEEGGKGYHLSLKELRTEPRLDFKGTELLTLSACQTAISESAASGMEIDGLGLLAQQRGAKAVLATLWSVDDESTGMLMTDFYSRWINSPGMNKGEALRQAQLAMLFGKVPSSSKSGGQPDTQGTFAHPYYWAPFVLIGNWR
jgi:CHAT domain-containing protein/tetratricopeptide (TPR) repeat protein